MTNYDRDIPVYRVRWTAVAALTALALVAATCAARAHSFYDQWRHPDTGLLCCNSKDCAPTAMCTLDTGAEGIVIEGQCRPIPWDAVLPMPSPDGQAHVCVLNGQVRCVALGAGA